MNTVNNRYTDGTYAKNNPQFGDDNSGWKVANALKAITEWNIPHQSIAEVGCGGGAIIKDVASALNIKRAVGYEPMPEAYAIAKTRESDNLKYLNETVDNSSKDNFDLVLCFDVFEHVEDYFTFIRNLKNISNRFLFHIPLDLNAQMVARMSPIMNVRESVGHLHYFSKDTALAALRDCGLDVSGSFYTFGGDSSYNGTLYKLLKFPRKVAYMINQDLAVRTLGGWSLMVYATAENE